MVEPRGREGGDNGGSSSIGFRTAVNDFRVFRNSEIENGILLLKISLKDFQVFSVRG
jgi:hypothetical protein